MLTDFCKVIDHTEQDSDVRKRLNERKLLRGMVISLSIHLPRDLFWEHAVQEHIIQKLLLWLSVCQRRKMRVLSELEKKEISFERGEKMSKSKTEDKCAYLALVQQRRLNFPKLDRDMILDHGFLSLPSEQPLETKE